jgi:hypothetical protein
MGAIYPVFQPLHFCFGCQGFAWLVLVAVFTWDRDRARLQKYYLAIVGNDKSK